MDLLEKMDLLDVVDEGLTALKNGVQDLLEKMDWLDKVDEALSKLNASVKKSDSLLDKLLAGEFINATPNKFQQILRKVWEQVKSNVDIIRKPLLDFLNAHKADMVFESAENGVFESVSLDSPLDKVTGPKGSGAVRITSNGIEYGAPQNITIDIDTDFDSPETFRDIIRAIEQAREIDSIMLKVNSHGGRTDSAQAIYVALLETRARTIAKVITAYSSGSIVTMACDEIQTTPHCTMMIHNASSGTWGKVGEMKAQSNFMENHFKLWFNELYSGFLTKEEIDDVFKGQDIWLREEDIKKRLPNWKPIRVRRASEKM